jgi:hypothetical protein
VCATLQFSQKGKLPEIFILDLPHFKNIVRADFHAIALSFASIAIHDRKIRTSFGPALFSGPVGVLRSSPRFLGVQVRLPSCGVCSRRASHHYLPRISSIARRRIARTLFLSSVGASNFS